MKKNGKSKKSIPAKTKIIILFVILLILLIVCIYLYFNSVEIMNRVLDEQSYESLMEDKVIPNGSFLFASNYEGDLDEYDFYRSLYNFVNNLPDYLKDAKKAKNLEDYYTDNKQELDENLGVLNFEEFKTFVDGFNSYGDLGKYQTSSIDTDTFENTKYYLSFDMTMSFSGLDSPLEFRVSFANRDMSNRSTVVFEKVD